MSFKDDLKTFGWASAGDIASSGLGILANNMLQRQNYKWSEKSAENAYNRQMEMYNRMYQDKSPLNVVKQLNEAGLNKSLMFAGGAGGVGGSASGAGVPMAQQFQTQQLNKSNLALTIAQMRNIEADTNLKNTQANKTGAEIPVVTIGGEKIKQEIENLIANAENTRQQTELYKIQSLGTDLDNKLKSGTLTTNIETANQELLNLTQQFNESISRTELNEEQRKNISEMRDYYQAEILSKVTLNKANANLTAEQTKQVIESVKTIMPYLNNELEKTTINRDNVDNQIERLEWEKITFGVTTMKDMFKEVLGNFMNWKQAGRPTIERTTTFGKGNSIKTTSRK